MSYQDVLRFQLNVIYKSVKQQYVTVTQTYPEGNAGKGAGSASDVRQPHVIESPQHRVPFNCRHTMLHDKQPQHSQMHVTSVM